jgi:hypothetical protein
MRKDRIPRCVVTNLRDEPPAPYEHICCARGEMENRIEKCQPALFADRTGCHPRCPIRSGCCSRRSPA